MKAFFPILLSLSMLASAIGQEAGGEAILTNEVQNAIREFNHRKNTGKEQEVVVVLPPPDSPSAPEVEKSADEASDADVPPADIEAPAGAKPTLVTGKPPAKESGEDAEGKNPVEVAEMEPVGPAETAPAGKDGLGIRVEPIRDGKGGIALGQIKLKASFPAKALSTTPDGWILEKSDQAPAFLEEVTLRPGKTISLSISPHILTPASDGANTFAVVEPGFEVSKGYRQASTVSAILGNSVVQLDHDALLLGNAISDLHQLLASLPRPEPEPEDSPKP